FERAQEGTNEEERHATEAQPSREADGAMRVVAGRIDHPLRGRRNRLQLQEFRRGREEQEALGAVGEGQSSCRRAAGGCVPTSPEAAGGKARQGGQGEGEGGRTGVSRTEGSWRKARAELFPEGSVSRIVPLFIWSAVA